ncbi:MAG: hypothetical protein KF754_07245 [Planctomycetes bacterium]|nr:hypothetical protein [Planctomycetota bacterium]
MTSEETNVEWLERDRRQWLALANMPDMLTARMFVTMLESNELEGRVGTNNGQFVIEVPAEQYEAALAVYHPGESGITPPLEEARQKTGIHTGRRIKHEMATRALQRKQLSFKAIMVWLLMVAVVGTGLAMAWLFLS